MMDEISVEKLVRQVCEPFEGFFTFDMDKHGEVCRVIADRGVFIVCFERKSLNNCNIYEAFVIMREGEIAVSKYCYPKHLYKEAWISLGDPDLVEKIHNKLGEYLNFG